MNTLGEAIPAQFFLFAHFNSMKNIVSTAYRLRVDSRTTNSGATLRW
jgi:hypothetical protein